MAIRFLSTNKQVIAYKNNPPDFFSTKRIIILRLIGRDVATPVTYDKELDTYFADDEQTSLTFEYCLDTASLEVAKSLRKAKDFLRVIEHRYDWMNLKVNLQKGSVKILNKDEITNNWERMQKRLLEDYEGIMLEHFFATLGNFSYPVEKEWPCLTQYTAFGLLFPHIPLNIRPNWTRKRNIHITHNDPIFEEEIRYRDEVEDKLYFDIIGNVSSSNEILGKKKCILHNYTGEIIKKKQEVLPELVNIKLDYQRHEYTIKWSFELTKI